MLQPWLFRKLLLNFLKFQFQSLELSQGKRKHLYQRDHRVDISNSRMIVFRPYQLVWNMADFGGTIGKLSYRRVNFSDQTESSGIFFECGGKILGDEKGLIIFSSRTKPIISTTTSKYQQQYHHVATKNYRTQQQWCQQSLPWTLQ